MDYCMHAYDAKNSDHQIKNSPIPTESEFAKFNACQTFLLYSIIIIDMVYYNLQSHFWLFL